MWGKPTVIVVPSVGSQVPAILPGSGDDPILAELAELRAILDSIIEVCGRQLSTGAGGLVDKVTRMDATLTEMRSMLGLTHHGRRGGGEGQSQAGAARLAAAVKEIRAARAREADAG